MAIKKPAAAATAAKPEPAAYPLLAYLDELVEQLRTHVSKALKEWDEEGVHQSRVATRRLKAALDLYKPVLSKNRRRPFGTELRKLRRRLGPLRDVDVMLGHIAEFSGEEGRLAPAAAWASASLLRERDAARAKSRKQAPPSKVLSRLGRWWGIREQFAEASEAVDTLLAESLHLQVDAFAEEANVLLAQHQRAAAAAADSPDATPSSASPATQPLDPHELRITGKALRYTLEMASRQGHDLPKSVGKSFKQMQEHLGLWHDYVVLADRLLSEAVATRLGHFDAPLKDRVLDLSKASLRKATRELDRFYRLWTDRGEAIARGIRAAFPLTEHPPVSEAVAPSETMDVSSVPAGHADRAPSSTETPAGPPPPASEDDAASPPAA